jgi:hypothetical protein
MGFSAKQNCAVNRSGITRAHPREHRKNIAKTSQILLNSGGGHFSNEHHAVFDDGFEMMFSIRVARAGQPAQTRTTLTPEAQRRVPMLTHAEHLEPNQTCPENGWFGN